MAVEDENVPGLPMQARDVCGADVVLGSRVSTRHPGGGSQNATVKLGFAVSTRRAQYHQAYPGLPRTIDVVVLSAGITQDWPMLRATSHCPIPTTAPFQRRARLRDVRPRMARELRAKTRVINRKVEVVCPKP